MTEKVNPSPFRPVEAFKTAGSIHNAGGGENYVVDPSSPTQISSQDTGIDETQFTGFGIQTSASSFDVTIEPGEAFVFGSWLAIDTNTTVTLASSTNNQTIYVGWDKDASNDVIIGLASAFNTAADNTDQKIPLYDVDTDGSGVTGSTDRRIIGYTQGETRLKDDQRVLFGTDDDFSVDYNSSSNELELTDETNSTTKQTWDKSGDSFFPNGTVHADGSPAIDLSGDMEDSNTTIWNSSGGYLEQTALENDSITVSGGNALTGGSASLGGSVTLSVDSNSIQTDELDLSISPTWTSSHQFSSGLDIRANLVDDTTTIWNSTAGYLEQTALENDSLSVAGNNVSLGGSTTVDYVDLSDTGTSFPIPNSDLSNSSVTVAGNSVSLGGSTTVDYVDLNDTGTSFPIPNSDLSNDTITVSGGNALSGGSASLGGSVTVNVDSNSIQTDEIDQSISPTWTSSHQFSSGLDTRGNLVDDTTTIWNSSGGYVEQTALENDTVTITGGNALTAGSVSLGGSVTVSVDSNSIQTDEIDESISPTWNSSHTFSATLSADGGPAIDVSGDIEDGTTTIWNSSGGYVEQTALENDTVTITGGNALTAGSVSLGGSVTVSVDSNSIQTDEIDESISPTWNSSHTFSATLSADGGPAIDVSGDIEDGTTTIWNSSAGYVEQTSLENDTITITGGNALTAGSVSLGGSVTVSVDSNSIQTDEIDLSISPTWTSQHQFSAGIDTRGNIVDDTTTIWNSSGGYVEQTALENDSVTITSGNALSGGGTISLGGSLTLDVPSGSIQTNEIDESISPTWTSSHTFSATLSADATTAIDATGDIRLATGQSFEDGGATDRLSFESNKTRLNDDSGSSVLQAFSGGDVFLYENGNNALTLQSGGLVKVENGSVRVPNTQSIVGRNSGGNGDLGITFTSSDTISLDVTGTNGLEVDSSGDTDAGQSGGFVLPVGTDRYAN